MRDTSPLRPTPVGPLPGWYQARVPRRPAEAAAAPNSASRQAGGGHAIWIERFLLLQIACQLLLIVPQLGPLRIVVRLAAFSASLALLAFLPGKRAKHPADFWGILVVVIVGLMWFHPTTNSPLSGLAQAGLYVAIIAPLFWVSRLRVELGLVRGLLSKLWMFHAAGSSVGILQVYFPGRFQPTVSAMIQGRDEGYVDSLLITLDSGEQVFRPMGLTDVPGGAAIAGFYVVLLGAGFLLESGTSALRRALLLASMAGGMACIYLSQVRAVLVMLAVCVVAFGGVLWVSGRAKRFFAVALGLALVASAGYYFSTSIAETSVNSRLSTLVEGDPGNVYNSNRGRFLAHTIDELLPEYPFGAGTGRWGTMNAYFGDNSRPDRRPIWVEIQWTGWLLDGGVPLIIVYLGAILAALFGAFRIAIRAKSAELSLWAALIFGHGFGVLALTFSYPVFLSQTGLEFWLLSAALVAAARSTPLHPPAPSRSPPVPRRIVARALVTPRGFPR